MARGNIDVPFHGSRKDVLAKFYHVQPRPEPVRKITDKELLRAGAASVLLAVIGALLVMFWPIGERISR